MRYQDWDVLLFPEGSKVPIQEFKTQCYTVSDPESASLRSSVNDLSYYSGHRPTLLPTLTTFVPNLEQGTPFRVSIHSWHTPHPSLDTEKLMHRGDKIVFEARCIVDGRFVAVILFREAGPWPQLLTSISGFDFNGDQEALKFPPFHQEILTQNFWTAGENLGRIKIIMAEGIVREQRNLPFERTRNIVTFSFQHAPLDVLETTGIAWPNPMMWQILSYQDSNNLAPSGSNLHSDLDAHAHSPRRRASSGVRLRDATASLIPFYSQSHSSMPPPQLPNRLPGYANTRWSPAPGCIDPFLDSFGRGQLAGWERQPSSEYDQSMPDYSISDQSKSPTQASSRNITGDGYTKLVNVSASMLEDQDDSQPDSSSLRKDSTNSTFTIAKQGFSDASPIRRLKPSAAAQIRAASYTEEGCRTASRTDITILRDREVSDISMKTSLSEEGQKRTEDTDPKKIHEVPATSIKGKKENKFNDVEVLHVIRDVASSGSAGDHRCSGSATGRKIGTSSVSKRKRSQASSSQVTFREEDVQSSPTWKVSKAPIRDGEEKKEIIDLSETSDREPLAPLPNVN
ncbi:MAG: hypothetical protein M1827_001356 [Pycnora praestabilis]|nr:MAG: hypothetical protein M1827_001356 [Pycnora praestabilis]